MKNSPFLLRLLAGWAVLSTTQIIAGKFTAPAGTSALHALPWLLAAWLLTTAVLAWAGLRSGWGRRPLAMAFFALLGGTTLVNIVEGVFYLNLQISWTRVFFIQLVAFGLTAAAMAFLFSPGAERGPMVAGRGGAWGAIWRFAVCDLLYLVLYLTAGMIIYPFVRSFYATQHIPPMTTLIGLQLLLRGPVFTVLCVLLARMLDVRRRDLVAPMPGPEGPSTWKVALSVGTIFATLTGVVPLMVPSTFFPDAVRYVHFCEVTSSNFLFGCLTALIWSRWLRPATSANAVLPAQQLRQQST